MASQVITKPAVEPLTLDEAKAHLVVEHNIDDDLIASLIVAAREYAETCQWRSLITQTRELQLDTFDGDCIPLPCGPIQSIVSIKYIDVDGTEQTLDTAYYSLDAVNAQVVLGYQQTWPSTRNQPGAVKVRYVAGYGDSGSDVPETTKQAMKLLIAHWYANREDVAPGNLKQIPTGAESLLRLNSNKRFV